MAEDPLFGLRKSPASANDPGERTAPSDSDPTAVEESAAAEQQHHEDDDEQSGRVHFFSPVCLATRPCVIASTERS
jgi:hypothetical protein